MPSTAIGSSFTAATRCPRHTHTLSRCVWGDVRRRGASSAVSPGPAPSPSAAKPQGLERNLVNLTGNCETARSIPRAPVAGPSLIISSVNWLREEVTISSASNFWCGFFFCYRRNIIHMYQYYTPLYNVNVGQIDEKTRCGRNCSGTKSCPWFRSIQWTLCQWSQQSEKSVVVFYYWKKSLFFFLLYNKKEKKR